VTKFQLFDISEVKVELEIKYIVPIYFPLVVRDPKPQGDHFPRYTKTQHSLLPRCNQLLNKILYVDPIVLEDIDPSSEWVVENQQI
jgi:hypothetical protein